MINIFFCSNDSYRGDFIAVLPSSVAVPMTCVASCKEVEQEVKVSKECLVKSTVNKYAVKFSIECKYMKHIINLLSFSYDGTPTHKHIAVYYLLQKQNFPKWNKE